jgi:hypothetical protein
MCPGDWDEFQFPWATEATGKCKLNREQRTAFEQANRRLNILPASLLMISDDQVGGVQSQDELKAEIHLWYE